MGNDTVMVLTSKSVPTMLKEGGAGHWRANERSIRRCRWLVAVRNRHSTWSQGSEEHGAAFLLGRLTGVKPSPNGNGRIVITFDRYAEISIPSIWPADHRNPVAYTELESIGIDPDKLDWKEFANAVNSSAPAIDSTSPASTIEQARMMIARAFAIEPSAVKISIDV